MFDGMGGDVWGERIIIRCCQGGKWPKHPDTRWIAETQPSTHAHAAKKVILVLLLKHFWELIADNTQARQNEGLIRPIIVTTIAEQAANAPEGVAKPDKPPHVGGVCLGQELLIAKYYPLPTIGDVEPSKVWNTESLHWKKSDILCTHGLSGATWRCCEAWQAGQVKT